MRQRNPLHGDERYEHRVPWIAVTKDGKECRDRLSWGGITSERACSCVGACRYDQEKVTPKT